jgi:hypothetical protein
MAESIVSRVYKLETDMYHGDGKENPSMTTRMALVEDRLEKLSYILGKLTWVLVAAIFAIIGQVVLRMLKLM